MAALASSASAERLFSAARKMHDDLKKSTTEETLEDMLKVSKINPMLDFLSNLHLIGDQYAYYNCNFISLYSNGIEFIDIVK